MVIAVEWLVPLLFMMLLLSWAYFKATSALSERKAKRLAAFERRPWGSFTVLHDAPYTKVKTITVDPGHRLSLQSHNRREEHWVVVQGEATVEINKTRTVMHPGEHVFIPQGAHHRISNTSSSPLVFVEVQTGSYFGEDDIVRYEDDYKRIR